MNKVVALIGNPNVGKSTLFNALTGQNQAVGNWPGVTVDQHEGHYIYQNQHISVWDLPGCSDLVLEPNGSLDEQITCQYLTQHSPDLIVNVIDATHLDRQLYLTLQLIESGYPLLVIINKVELAQRQVGSMDMNRLSQLLGCRVEGFTDLSDIESLKKVIAEYQPQLGHLTPKSVCTLEKATERYQRIDEIMSQVQIPLMVSEASISERLDRWVLHRMLALPIFLSVMLGFFVASAMGGRFFEDLLKSFTGPLLLEYLPTTLASMGAPEFVQNTLSGLGVGLHTVLGFVPIVAVMFLCLSYLESSGYMVRAAFVVDRLMRWIGISGQAMIPMILGFGCNVPGILGTRTLKYPRERMLTILMMPFMSCNARLVIYALFASTFFPEQTSLVIFALYCLGIGMAIFTGLLLRRSVFQNKPTHWITEFPDYQIPKFTTLLSLVRRRVFQFVKTAGQWIIPLCMVFKAFPHSESALAYIAQSISPVFSPMGLSQEHWQPIVGLMSGVFAKELVIGTLGGLSISSGGLASLFPNTAAVFAFLIFTALYFPCVSVVAMMAKELSWRWAIFSIVWTTGLAYVAAVVFYQGVHWHMKPMQSSLWITAVLAFLGLLMWMIKKLSVENRGSISIKVVS